MSKSVFLYKIAFMPARPNLANDQRQLLAQFGERLRLARLRRRLSAQQVADSAGITRVTLHRAEAGDAAVTMGTYIKVMAAMAEPIHSHGEELIVTVSVGVASGTSSVRPEGLLRQADAALYRAKHQGRNRIVSQGPDA